MCKENFDSDLTAEEIAIVEEYYRKCSEPGSLDTDLFGGAGRGLKRRSALTLMHEPPYELTEEDLDQLSNDKKVRKRLKKMNPRWLKGDNINYIAALLNLGFASKKEKVHAFGTDFYVKIDSEGPEVVLNWEKKVVGGSIMDLDKVLLPYSDGSSHYQFAVVNVPERTVHLYDSNGDASQTLVDEIATKITDLFDALAAKHHRDKIGKFHGIPKKSHRQRNGYDCGMFTIMNMVAVSLGLDPKSQGWSQREIPHCRNRIMLLLMKDKRW